MCPGLLDGEAQVLLYLPMRGEGLRRPKRALEEEPLALPPLFEEPWEHLILRGRAQFQEDYKEEAAE